MSYDLYLFAPPPRRDPLEAARAAYAHGDGEGPRPAGEDGRARMRALATAVAAAEPSLAAEAHDGTPGEEYVELYGPDDGPGLHLVIFPRAAFVHLPFWHAGEDAEAAWAQALRCIAVLEREAGYRTYDPQRHALLDPAGDRGPLLAEYARGVEVASRIAAAPAPVPVPVPVPARRPWWKLWG